MAVSTGRRAGTFRGRSVSPARRAFCGAVVLEAPARLDLVLKTQLRTLLDRVLGLQLRRARPSLSIEGSDCRYR